MATSLAKNVRYYRKQKGLTQLQLAEMLGYDTSSISKIEAGKVDVPISKLVQLSSALGCKPENLMCSDIGTNAQLEVFSKNLNQLLSQNKLKQNKVAEAIGVIPSTFNTWCKAICYPNMESLTALCQYFGVSMDTLMGIHVETKEKPKKEPTQRITVEKVAELLGCSKQFIRIGLQRKALDFGSAVKTGNDRYSYLIYPDRLANTMGISLEELERRLTWHI